MSQEMSKSMTEFSTLLSAELAPFHEKQDLENLTPYNRQNLSVHFP